MRSIASSLVCLAWIVACTANNTIADSRSRSEQVADEAPPFCARTCQRFTECVPEGCVCTGDVCECFGPDPECESSCLEALETYRQEGESCAQMAMDAMDCFDTLSCDELRGNHRCEDIIEAHPECSGEPPSTDPIDVSGSGGASPGGPAVVCMGASSTGAAGSAGSTGGPSISCDQSVMSCADGHDYRVFCLTGTDDQSTCNCIVDNLVQSTFLFPQRCPLVQEVNAFCAWNLAQFGI